MEKIEACIDLNLHKRDNNIVPASERNNAKENLFQKI